jgi:hypothetical protein
VPEQINSTLGDDLMIVESIIGIVVTLTVVYLFWQAIIKEAGSVVVEKIDVNKDGKTDVKDFVVALEKSVSGLASVADVNKDGKVNLDDAKAVAKKTVSIADVNKDGKVNLDDVKAVAKKVEDTVSTAVSKTKKATKKLAESSIKAPVVAETTTPKRARKNGKLVADNPATPEVNEAWEGGKAPEKATKPKKPKKPKMTVAK